MTKALLHRMRRRCSKMHDSCLPWSIRFCLSFKEKRKSYLEVDGMNSEAIAHIYADAEFNPPPQSRIIEDSQTILRGKILGKAPEKALVSSRHGKRGSSHTNNKDLN
jgi:hypothetical protein